jgi:hypothetical protein
MGRSGSTASSTARNTAWKSSATFPRRAAHRRRGGLAIQPPRPRRPDQPSRPDPHRRQLERHLARPRRHAQSQRLADQGGRQILTLWSEDFTDDFSSRASAPGSRRASRSSTTPPTSAAEEVKVPAAARRKARPRLRRPAQARESHHGRLRRGLHGHVQRHHPRRTAPPHRRFQGAAQPVRPLRENAHRQDEEARAVYDGMERKA